MNDTIEELAKNVFGEEVAKEMFGTGVETNKKETVDYDGDGILHKMGEKMYELIIPMCGVDKKQVEVSIKEDKLSITTTKGVHGHIYNFNFLLEPMLDSDNMIAKLENGIMEINIPIIRPKRTVITIL